MRAVYILLLAGFFGLITVAMMGVGTSFHFTNYETREAQPIPFPHDVHAGAQNIPCVKCHVYVDKSRQATIPAMSVCAECHANMQSDKPGIIALQKYLADNVPVPWVRIHKLPDHVYFSHKRHIKYFEKQGETYEHGQICQKCHGDMTVVKEVKQVRTLQMGFCVSCHRANNAPQDCWTCHK